MGDPTLEHWYAEIARLNGLRPKCRCGGPARASYNPDPRNGRTISLLCVCGRSTLVWVQPHHGRIKYVGPEGLFPIGHEGLGALPGIQGPEKGMGAQRGMGAQPAAGGGAG